jgi:hypothetical protein
MGRTQLRVSGSIPPMAAIPVVRDSGWHSRCEKFFVTYVPEIERVSALAWQAASLSATAGAQVNQPSRSVCRNADKLRNSLDSFLLSTDAYTTNILAVVHRPKSARRALMRRNHPFSKCKVAHRIGTRTRGTGRRDVAFANRCLRLKRRTLMPWAKVFRIFAGAGTPTNSHAHKKSGRVTPTAVDV